MFVTGELVDLVDTRFDPGPGESLDGFDGPCPSWSSVISERNHRWGVKGETPTVDGIFTRILTCGWSGRHSQLTHGRACVASSAAAD